MKISAIIVTFNREKLLKNCIEAVSGQSLKPNRIIIVDNASTDGTERYIKELLPTRKDIRYVKLQYNTGGAGGFYHGMKTAYEEDKYDAFWMMDDDGVPDCYCLENLVRFLDKFAFISPLVVDVDAPQKMAFGTLKEHNVEKIKQLYPNGIIECHANPFNGVIFRRDLVEKIGYPKQEMFIWGDENEYEARIIKYGYKYATIINAIHYHPKDRLVLLPDFLGKKSIIYVDSELKRYCKYRNFAYVLYKYKHWYNVIIYILRYTFFFLVNRKVDIKGLSFFYKAVKDGLNNNFENHKKYIQC